MRQAGSDCSESCPFARDPINEDGQLSFSLVLKRSQLYSIREVTLQGKCIDMRF